jgi:predicted DNA binding protein
MVAADGRAEVVAEVATGTELRPIVDGVRAVFPATEFVAKRRLGRSPVTPGEYYESLEDQLTERQLETLRAAYLGAYFEWPRGRTASEIAAAMGVADTTWLRHLRKAEATLVEAFLREVDQR